jgi:hypothetical protein
VHAVLGRAGVRREEPTGTTDWKEVQKKLRERLLASDDNVLEIVRKGEELSFKQWAGLFLENYSKPPLRSPKTHEANARAVKHLVKAFGDQKLADLTTDAIEGYLRYRSRQRAKWKTKGGIVEKGVLKPSTVHPGAAGASAYPQRCGAQEAAAVESVLGRRVPGRGERVVPAALRLVVGAAADRGGAAELLAQRRSRYHGNRTSDPQGTDQ